MKKLSVKIQIKSFRNGKTIFRASGDKKIKIYKRFERNFFKNTPDLTDLQVLYKGLGENASLHKNPASLKNALDAYLEPALINFLGD